MSQLTVSTTEADEQSTLAAAIAAAPAGTTISVRPGTYREAVVLTRDVVIEAAQNPGSVVIEPPTGSAVLVAGGSVTLRGLTFRGGSSTLPVLQLADGDLSLEGCDVSASGIAAVHVRGGTIRMSGGTVRNSGGAGLIVEAGSGRFTGCTIQDAAGTAVVLSGTATPVFDGCTVSGAGEIGVLSGGSSGALLKDCRIERVRGVSVLVQGKSRLRMTGTTVDGGQGNLYLSENAVPVLESCRFTSSGSHGVVLRDRCAPRLKDCVVDASDGHGIHVSGEAAGRFTGGRVEGTEAAGIMVGEKASPTFSGCEITGCRDSGIVLTGSCTPGFERVVITGSPVGVSIQDQADPLLRRIRVTHAEYGIYAIGGAGRVENSELAEVTLGPVITGSLSRITVDGIPSGAGIRAAEGDEEGLMDEALADLDALVGLPQVKRDLTAVIKLHQVVHRQQAAGMTTMPAPRHLVFSGGPGSGRATVARIYGRALAALAVVASGQVRRLPVAELSSGGEGLSDSLTARLHEAAGGVLIVDLSPGDEVGTYPAAAATLVTMLERYEDDLVVVLAGDASLMRSFLQADPGLNRWFTRTLEFRGYSSSELASIVENLCRVNHYVLEQDAVAPLTARFDTLPQPPGTGTARLIFEEIIGTQARRLAREPEVPDVELVRILADDLAPDPSADPAAGRTGLVNSLLRQLTGMTGMLPVKQRIIELAGMLAGDKGRLEVGLTPSVTSRNQVFVGAPGTGKTSVARVYAQVLAAMDLLATGRLMEMSALDLLGANTDETVRRIRDALGRADGGVLLLNRLPELGEGSRGEDLGRTVIDTLTRLVSTQSGDVVLVLTGDAARMQAFLGENPEFAAKFATPVEFAAYSVDELTAIFVQLVTAESYRVSAETLDLFRGHMNQIPRDEAFGNGRYLRFLLDRARTRHAVRLSAIATPSLSDLEVLSPGDVLGGLEGEVETVAPPGRRSLAFRRLAGGTHHRR